jgi:hypothetical protein
MPKRNSHARNNKGFPFSYKATKPNSWPKTNLCYLFIAFLLRALRALAYPLTWLNKLVRRYIAVPKPMAAALFVLPSLIGIQPSSAWKINLALLLPCLHFFTF